MSSQLFFGEAVIVWCVCYFHDFFLYFLPKNYKNIVSDFLKAQYKKF